MYWKENLDGFLEHNQDYIYDKTVEKIYVDGGYLDDYDIGNINPTAGELNDFGISLYEDISLSPGYYIDEINNRFDYDLFLDCNLQDLFPKTF